MARNNNSSAPHSELIRKGETIEIDSVFQFRNGFEELNSFLNACSVANCTVKFLNENITAVPGESRMLLTIYATIAADPKIAEDYMLYLMKLNRGEIRQLP